MLRHNETLLVILVVLSMIVQSALAHNNGVTIAQADVELNRLGNASELQVRAAGKGTLEEVGDFNHLQGSIHEIDIYLHVWIAEVFPEYNYPQKLDSVLRWICCWQNGHVMSHN